MGVGVGVSHACGARLTVEQRAHGMSRRRQSFKLIMMSRGEALARSACWYCVCVDTHSTYNNLVHRRCGIQHTGELRGNAIDSKRTTGHMTR